MPTVILTAAPSIPLSSLSILESSALPVDPSNVPLLSASLTPTCGFVDLPKVRLLAWREDGCTSTSASPLSCNYEVDQGRLFLTTHTTHAPQASMQPSDRASHMI